MDKNKILSLNFDRVTNKVEFLQNCLKEGFKDEFKVVEVLEKKTLTEFLDGVISLSPDTLSEIGPVPILVIAKVTCVYCCRWGYFNQFFTREEVAYEKFLEIDLKFRELLDISVNEIDSTSELGYLTRLYSFLGILEKYQLKVSLPIS